MPGDGPGGSHHRESGGALPPHLTRGVLSLWAAEGKWAEVSLAGVSMTPLIPDGSRLTVRFGRGGLAVGDVILYATPTHLIAHRVLRLGRGGRRWGWLKVKGDPLHAGEGSWIPVEDVVGRVVAVTRPSGERILLNTPAGRRAGRLAALVSGPVARAEGAVTRRLLGREILPLTRLLLGGPAFLYGRTVRESPGMRGAFLDPARRFLLLAARLEVEEAGRVRLSEMLEQDLPWERIVPAATRLGLAPVLYRNLSHPGLSRRVPPAALAALRRGAHGSACLMAIQMEGLESVDAALRREGIVPVLLKGTGLAVTLYQQPALRPMQDIDLLVGEEQVHRAVAILEGMGLKGIRGGRSPEFYARHHHALPLIDGKGRLVVEIHRGLVPPSEGMTLEMEPILARTLEVRRGQRSYRVLSREDQILHSALHLAHTDRFMGRLRDLMDIHALTESAGSPDWSLLIEASRSWAASRSLVTTLDLARLLLGTPVPVEVISELGRGARWDPLAAGLVRLLGRWSLFEGGAGGRVLSDPVIKAICDSFLKRSRWSERVRALAASLTPQARMAL